MKETAFVICYTVQPAAQGSTAFHVEFACRPRACVGFSWFPSLVCPGCTPATHPVSPGIDFSNTHGAE